MKETWAVLPRSYAHVIAIHPFSEHDKPDPSDIPGTLCLNVTNNYNNENTMKLYA